MQTSTTTAGQIWCTFNWIVAHSQIQCKLKSFIIDAPDADAKPLSKQEPFRNIKLRNPSDINLSTKFVITVYWNVQVCKLIKETIEANLHHDSKHT